MFVEQIGIGPARVEKELQNAVGAVAVVQAGPAVDSPRDGPAGGAVAASIECDFGGLRKVRRASGRDLGTGEQRVKMRDMAMLQVAGFLIPIFKPFLKLPLRTDLQ